MNKLLSYIFLASYLVIYTGVSFSQQIYFEHYSNDQGLSSESVNSILQDNFGFLWIGTDAGLDRFDGYDFKVYGNEIPSSSGLESNEITSLLKDNSGCLWVGTDGGGLYRYNRIKDRFVRFGNDTNLRQRLSNQHINALLKDSRGIWAATDYGLNLINTTTKNISYYKNNDPNQNNITSVCPSGNNKYWIGVEKGGVYQFDPNTGIYTPLLKHLEVHKVFVDSRGLLWIGTSDKGLICYDVKKNTYTYYKNIPGDNSSISGNNIMDIFEDNSHILWIATYSGLNKFDYSSKKFVRYKNNSSNFFSISSNIVNTIYQDREGSLWVGTHNGGLNKTNISQDHFENYLNSNITGDRTNVDAFLEDSKRQLWVGTFGGGIYIFNHNMKLNKRILYRSNNSNDISSNIITHLYKGKKRYIWISTGDNGLDRYDPLTGNITTFKSGSKGSISGNFVTDVYEDSNGDLWVGTYGSGLNKFNRATNTFISWKHNPRDPNSLINNFITGIFEDELGNFWIATKQGLDKMDRKSGKFSEFAKSIGKGHSLSDKEILSMFVDSRKNFWVGTYGSGLYKVDRKTGNCTKYTELNGLSSNEVYGILEDNKSNLWLSTNHGITKFNPLSKKTVVYTTSDGLAQNEFSEDAYFKDSMGELLFGGINGITLFNPKNFVYNKTKPNVFITGLNILNKPVDLSDTSIAKGLLSRQPKIELQYDDNTFSFKFASLSFVNPSANKYAYRLEGYNANWLYTEASNRTATFINIPPGSYIFHVIASNNDGIWNRDGVQISIIIVPPWWKTWWAYLIFIIIFIGLITFIIKYQIYHTKRIEKAKFEERDVIRKELAADFHDGSGDKLAQILMFSKFLQSNIGDQSKEITNSVNWIVDASEKLKSETEDFLWTLDSEVNSLYDVCIKLKTQGFNLFGKIQTHVDFRVVGIDSSFKDIKLSLDWKRNILFIFKEALNNSLKYSNCSNVSLEFEIEKTLLTITYCDNGIGFDEGMISEGNGLKNMKRRASKIGGEFSIKSEANKGTRIIFHTTLPN